MPNTIIDIKTKLINLLELNLLSEARSTLHS